MMPENFSEFEFIVNLSDNAKTSLQHANIIAQGYKSSYIGTEHILLGILAQGASVGAKILADFGVTLEKTHDALNLSPLTTVIAVGIKNLSETAKLTLKLSWELAQNHNQHMLGTEHILYSIITQKNSRASLIIQEMGVNLDEIAHEIKSYISGLENNHKSNESVDTGSRPFRKVPTKRGILDIFGTDLTLLASQNKLDNLIGRSRELERTITILSRRSKNNPILIGEPGVGKTAIVEGLAQRINSEEVPDHLLDTKLIQIDLAGMVAGTKYRGEFEERLKRLMQEVKAQKNVILFIDEIHLLVGAGSAEGSVDAANILKPALARGEIRLIGATTLDEYRKHIEKDSALERRLQTVVIKQPSIQETIDIIIGLKDSYEKYHSVSITDEVVREAVYMSDRYINDRFMPDKAIDVIDEAAALLRVNSAKKPKKIRDYHRQIKDLSEKMDECVSTEDYERAALYKTRISQLNDMVLELEKEYLANSHVTLNSDDIAASISLISNIPVSRIQKSEASLLINLESHLQKFVVGQEKAIALVSKSIRRNRSGISSGSRPIGSFVFMGPTGVGKTELAKVLAREVFGSEDALVKIDMSEFSEKHSTSRLLGAPAGYVGYDDGGKLTDKIKRQPYSVVLFDEIEKAHRDIFNLLLQILEEGKLTDAQGHQIDFSNTIVILTSNLGSQDMNKGPGLGFVSDNNISTDISNNIDNAAKKSISNFMKPELINRFDAILVFEVLQKNQISQIFDILIGDLQKRLLLKGLSIVVSGSAKRAIIEKGYDKKFGARPLRRTIEDLLEHKIAEGLINGEYQKGTVLYATTKRGEVCLSIKSEA